LNDKLLDKIKLLPDLPGIYIFKNEKDEIIYVGKAIKLKKRVYSYFRVSNQNKYEKVRRIAEETQKMDFIVVQNENEALVLEANLIYENKPIYNIMMKDTRRYPYIRITDEEFPRINITRNRGESGTYFGPYTNMGIVKKLVELLQRIFQICRYDCNYAKKNRVCFFYHLKMCSAPCQGKISREDYMENVDGLKRFLDGDTFQVREELERRMYKLADNLQFEQAKNIRDILSNMDILYTNQAVEVDDGVNLDLIAISSGLAALFSVRGGMLLGKLIFDFNDGTISDFITQFYYVKKHKKPPLCIVDGISQREKRQFKGDFKYLGKPRNKSEERLLMIAYENINEEIKIRLSSTQSIKNAKEILGLSKLPKRIEGIDISHTQGLYTVASLVTFVNGKPDKNEYRRYRIANVEKPDDFLSMETVIKRRYSKHPTPDLLFIDGGEPQLRAVKKALEELNITNLDFIGLAKEREEIVFPDKRKRLYLEPDHPVKRLIVSIRDETHRFAVNYHRVLRERRFKKSKIDSIPGIGPKRKKMLLEKFKSFKRLSTATEKELLEVLNNRKVVEDLINWLHNN